MRYLQLCGALFHAAVLFAAQSTAQAALHERLGGVAYYDDFLNITWLADTDFARTSGQDADGMMNWDDASGWLDSLTISGVSGWRLPSADVDADGSVVDCTGGGVPDCSDNELGHLYWEQGITAAAPGPFLNLSLLGQYWYGTQWQFDAGSAWMLLEVNGVVTGVQKVSELSVWAVHDGDVAVVPLPAAAWLLAGGLIPLLAAARRHRS